jgi:hypothetical protein
MKARGVMKKRFFDSVFLPLGGVIVLLAIPLSSCVHNDEMGSLSEQVNALTRRVDRLQETMNVKVGQNLEQRLDSLQRRQAELGLEMNQIKSTTVTLSGRVEDNEHIIKRSVERDLNEQDPKRWRI